MVKVFSQLQYQVLWKYEEDPENMPDLPENVRLGRWLPQQDLLGEWTIDKSETMRLIMVNIVQSTTVQGVVEAPEYVFEDAEFGCYIRTC